LKRLERVKGIEPSYSAWKAAALPLSYTRNFNALSRSSVYRWRVSASQISRIVYRTAASHTRHRASTRRQWRLAALQLGGNAPAFAFQSVMEEKGNLEASAYGLIRSFGLFASFGIQ
jgi:hypothetical protein